MISSNNSNIEYLNNMKYSDLIDWTMNNLSPEEIRTFYYIQPYNKRILNDYKMIINYRLRKEI